MAETFHVGDCTNNCAECQLSCAKNKHQHCLGTRAQKDWADWLLSEKGRGNE